MQNSPVNRLRITKVWAKNFRSIADATLELDPLTVLVGPNAAGKSNVLDIIRFISDALRYDLEAAIAMRQGLGGIRRRKRGGRPYNIELGVQAEIRGYFVDYSFIITSGTAGQYRVSREYVLIRSKNPKSKPIQCEIKDGNLVTPDFLFSNHDSQRSLFDTEISQFEASSLALPILRRMLLPSVSEDRKNEALARRTYQALTSFYLNLTRIRFYHIFPNSIREPQKLGTPYPLDDDGENFASVLREIQREHGNRMTDLKEALRILIPGISDAQVKSVGGFLVVQLRHTVKSAKGDSTWFDLSQESDGTLRLLGLLVALYQHPPIPFIGIEEPELTIHPGALATLADLLKEATKRSQLIITTHSPDLIDRFSIERLRVVDSSQGFTTVGNISDSQVEAVRQDLFTPGELHRNEGLELAKRN